MHLKPLKSRFEKNLFFEAPHFDKGKKNLSLILMLDSWLDFQFVKDLIGYGRAEMDSHPHFSDC